MLTGSYIDNFVRAAVGFAPRLVAAIVVLILGFWFAGWCARSIRRLAEQRQTLDQSLIGIFASVVRYAILIAVFLAVLGQLGVATTSVLAVMGAAGLAIGLALQGTLQNIAASIMLLWLKPFKVGDYIDTGIIAGTVKEIGLFATELQSWDGLYVFAPNSELWNKKIINYSRFPQRLVELKFGIAYDDDIRTARGVLLDMAKSDERVLTDPEPVVFVSTLGDSSVEIAMRIWTERTNYTVLLRDLTERGKQDLEMAGLNIPFPQLDVHVSNTQGLEKKTI